jgi:uncharacterized phage-associated protein
MPYKALAVANFFIEKARQEGKEDLTPLKLLKLIYIAHGWYLALMESSLIEEPIEAWRFGPVVSTIYQEFKHYGNSNIEAPGKEIKFEGAIAKNAVPEINKNDEETLALLNRVWEVYKKHTAIQLANWTHLPEGPWYKEWVEDGNTYPGHVISNNLIKEYFQGLASHGEKNRH